jgi:glucosamine--fructose-6-phosphate aminotransferase (isomerizing)
MCGIIGIFTTHENAREQAIDGLKKLEYRGYDSWGVASGGKKIVIEKNIGRISTIESKSDNKSNLAIGHTRWATHGGVTKINAHPHVDCSGRIAVVHNGIIENYQVLKKELMQKGHSFLSATDTEVIPHLIEEEIKYEPDFKKAFFLALDKLRGSFAVAVIRLAENEIWAVANGCPLVVGFDDDKKVISSDILACDTKKVVFIPSKTVVRVGEKLEFFHLETGNNRQLKFEDNNIDKHEITPGKYKHFLEKEINEQPEIIRKTSQMDKHEIETNAALIKHSFGTFFIACGTSFHAAVVGEYLFSRLAKMHINIVSAGEFSNFRHFITHKTLLFPISQSGETADVLEAAQVAKSKKAKILSLVNNPNSSLARMSDVVMVTPAGPEIAVLSTKAFTSQVAILYLLANTMVGKFEKARKNLAKVSKLLESLFEEGNLSKIRKLAHRIKNTTNLFTIGRGANYPVALEAALKIKEVSYIHAEGFAGGDLKHGPIALIEKNVPCIVFVANDENREEILSNAMEIKSRGGYIIGVAPEKNEIFDFHISVPDFSELSPIINIVPIQMLSYYLALERNCDPDKPRNLAKSVTVK